MAGVTTTCLSKTFLRKGRCCAKALCCSKIVVAQRSLLRKGRCCAKVVVAQRSLLPKRSLLRKGRCCASPNGFPGQKWLATARTGTTDQQISKPADQQTNRPADQQTSRPADQQTSKPADQQTFWGLLCRSGFLC